MSYAANSHRGSFFDFFNTIGPVAEISNLGFKVRY